MMAESKPASVWRVVFGVCLGVLAALIIGYAMCYVATHFGLGVIEASGDQDGGPQVFLRAALNLYAMQHVTLVGKNEDLFATISVPLSLWALLPALSLIVGGYCAASVSGVRSRFGMIACGICVAIIYAAVLAAGSRMIYARIDSFLMPELSGLQPNPQEFPFRPGTRTTLQYAGTLGLIFAVLGSLIAIRGLMLRTSPGKWWACTKSVVVTALVLQLFIVSAGALISRASGQKDRDSAPENRGMTVVGLLPTAAGIGYSMVHGAPLVAGVQSHMIPTEETRRPIYVRVSLQEGILKEELKGKSHERIRTDVVAAALVLGILAAMLMGRLAVSWGSRDGWLPTAFRIALINTVYLLLLVGYCSAELVTIDPVSVSAIVVEMHTGWWLLHSGLAVFVFSLIGASTGGRRQAAAMEV